MNQIKKNSELIKRCLIIALSVVILASSLALFFLSLETYEGGFDANMDYIVLLFCGIALFIYGTYSVYALKKEKSLHMMYYGCFGAISVLTGFYPLGVFFKALAKNKPFIENQEYLYIGIMGLIMLSYLIFSYLGDSNKNK